LLSKESSPSATGVAGRGHESSKSDAQRFHALIWPHRAAALRTARILTRNDNDADDLAQDALLKAFAGIASLKEGTNPRAWLMTILRHAHVDRLRAAKPVAVSLEQLVHDPVDETNEETSAPPADADEFWQNPDAAMERFADADLVRGLQSLPDEIRWTLLLVDVEQLDDQDAAGILGVPTGTIKSRLHRGRKMLREKLRSPFFSAQKHSGSVPYDSRADG
jgi:RNA polymerase sigma-70 factor, ECF subfamily